MAINCVWTDRFEVLPIACGRSLPADLKLHFFLCTGSGKNKRNGCELSPGPIFTNILNIGINIWHIQQCMYVLFKNP